MEKLINLKWDNEDKNRLIEIIHLGYRKSDTYKSSNGLVETKKGYIEFSIEFLTEDKKMIINLEHCI